MHEKRAHAVVRLSDLCNTNNPRITLLNRPALLSQGTPCPRAFYSRPSKRELKLGTRIEILFMHQHLQRLE